jgi:hypothetical protein
MRPLYKKTLLGNLVQQAVDTRTRVAKKLGLDAPSQQPLTKRLQNLTLVYQQEFPIFGDS